MRRLTLPHRTSDYASGPTTRLPKAPPKKRHLLWLIDGLPDLIGLKLTKDVRQLPSQLAAKPGATTFYTSDYPGGGIGVVGWDYGAGRAVTFSTVMAGDALADPNYARLVGNAVDWVTPVPEASTYIAGLLLLLPFSSQAARRARS